MITAIESDFDDERNRIKGKTIKKRFPIITMDGRNNTSVKYSEVE